MAFTPFLQSAEAQNIISNYLGGGYQAQPNLNSAGMWRNPQFDIRTQQELAGELDPSALYANPIMDWSATSTENETVDPCPVGYQLINGVCQPNEKFGNSMYDEKKEKEDKIEDPPYFSIEDMKGLEDFELLDYLNNGWLKGKNYETKVGGNFGMPLLFQALFGGQNKQRRDFIINELKGRGYNIDDKQGQQSLGQALTIIDNAQASNQGVMPNQVSYFTPQEINYQIQQSNNPNQGNYQAPQMTHQQVVQDAIASGGTVNPFEAQNINAGGNNNSTVSSPPMNIGNPFGYNNTPNKPPFLSQWI